MIARWGYLVGGVLIAIGVLLSPLMCCGSWVSVMSESADAEQFAVPGTHKFWAAEPGIFTIYNEVRGEFEGDRHGGSVDLPETVEFAITDLQLSEPIESYEDIYIDYEFESTRRVSTVTFEVFAGGWYEIEVSGLERERIFALERDPEFSPTAIVMTLGGSAVLIVAGIVLMIVTRFERGKPDRPQEFWVSHTPPGG